MQSIKAALCLLCTVVAPAAAAADNNPLGTVISLLDDLQAKIVKEGEAEAKAYKEYQAWCDDTSANTGFAIKTATSEKEELEATIAKAVSDGEAASSKIEELGAALATNDADLTSATQIRKKEAADFAASEAELSDIVDTLGRAINTLSREMAKNPAAFAQVSTTVANGNLVKSLSALVDAAAFASADKQKLLSMVQSQQNAQDEDDDSGAPAAAVYKSHSGNIVDVLEDLKEKAEEELGDLRKAETNARHNFEMLKQSLVDQMAADTKDMNEEKAAKSAAAELKASSEGDLAATNKELANSKKALETAKSTCMQVAADHEATVQNRADELKVIAEARKILSDTTNGAVEQTYSFIQGSLNSGSQLHTRADLAHAEIVNLVKKLAAEQHSAALAQLASRISAVIRYGAAGGEDPFVKVRELISNLISKLESEAGADATEKAYCDEQMSKTEEKKAELDGDISKLSAKIDQASAHSAKLKAQVRELHAQLAELAKSQAEMNALRKEQHAAYVQANADLQQGIDGVRRALSLLRDYYGSAAMVQTSDAQPAMPEQHSKATGAGESIIGILEVAESDFSKNLAAENLQEDDAQSSYDRITQENAITKTVKEQDVKYQTENFKALDKTISELSSDRATADTELSAVMEYYAKIKERCIAKPETYEERKARRTAEISGLKEALQILEEETALVQRRKRGFLPVHLGA
jgi:hypothetical protein